LFEILICESLLSGEPVCVTATKSTVVWRREVSRMPRVGLE
jgi:hypothetical protein